MIFGTILILAGELLRFIAVSYLGITSRSPEIQTDEFVSNGPYAYLRNPIYFGNLLLYMGASLFSGALLPYLFYLTIIFFLVFYALVVRYEESNLEIVFGNKFEKYIINVPRFFPRLSPYPDRGDSKADFGEAVNAEKSTLLTLLGFFALIVISWYIKS